MSEGREQEHCMQEVADRERAMAYAYRVSEHSSTGMSDAYNFKLRYVSLEEEKRNPWNQL